jgi:PilZ domain-containing protein
MERRRYRRINFRAPVFIESGNEITFGEVDNISNKGAFIRVSGSYAPDDPIVASIYFLEHGATLSVSIPGTIVRTTDAGVGFHSPHLDIYSLLHLENLLALNGGDHQQLAREFCAYLASRDSLNRERLDA